MKLPQFYFTQSLHTLLCTLVPLLLLSTITPLSAHDEDSCTKEVLLAYYPGLFVRSTLEKFEIPKSEWDAIIQKLNERDPTIIKQIEAEAGKMDPNPLKDPQQRQVAVKLFRDTLFKNFATVLKEHGVHDEKKIQAMLDDVHQQKARRFARCMEQQKLTPEPVQKTVEP